MSTSTILIIDDNAENLRVLKKVLDQPGRDVRAATSGPPAIALAQKEKVDLVLLDINMPGMDGYEVCRRLKANAATKDIPVLFLSANTETEDIVQGFALGGADYITKPFEIAEVEARVETHLQLSRLQKELARQNETLEAAVQSRTVDLKEANAKLTQLDSAKDDFFRLISHEVRTPLNGMVALEVALSDLQGPDPLEEAHGLFLMSFHRMVEIVDHAMALTEFQVEPSKASSSRCELRTIASNALRGCATFAAERGITLPTDVGWSNWTVPGNADHFHLALTELLKAALNLHQPTGAFSIHFASERSLVITTDGPVYSDEDIVSLFDICGSRVQISGSLDLGLGPCVANQVFNYLGVTLRTQCKPKGGIVFRLDFRQAKPPGTEEA